MAMQAGVALRSPTEARPARVLEVIGELLRELRGGEAPPPALDDDLELTLGIDSLARMELMLRLEQAFDVRLPEVAVQSAETPRDLVQAVASAAPRGAGLPAPKPTVATFAPPADVVDIPRRARTLVEVLAWHAERAPSRRHVLLLHDTQAPQPLDHAGLLRRAQQVAAALRREDLRPGETVAVMLPTSLAYLACFFGILIAGGVPVPIYPPFRPSQIEDHLRRQALILANAQAALLISDAHAMPAAHILHAGAPGLRAVLTVERLHATDDGWEGVARDAQDTALIQYTSGSTGQPKGVALTHANLLANIRAAGQALRAQPHDTFVSWLPLYHDMGLIGAWLGSLYHGVPLVLMPPQAFLARPSRWLRAISEHRATISAAPNFAYEIVAAKVPDDELQGLDLSTWRVAANGSEPVHAATIDLFCRRFARFGFDPHAALPVYGLAECGLGLTFPPLERGARIDVIDREALRDERRARPVGAGDARAMQVVSCGSPLPGHELRVVDERGAELPDRDEGRIQFRGPSATAGYVRNADANRALFDGEWLDTGDVGYVADGEVYLTSRAKDLIKRGGHNIHPYDLEAAAGALPGVRRGCVAVLGATDAQSGSERVVVVAETALVDAADRHALRDHIAELSLQVLGVPADEIVLAPPHTVLKTSSGKIRRAACRALYEEGRLVAPARAPAWQMARLWVDALHRRIGRPARRIGAALFAIRAWSLFGVGAILGVAATLLPVESSRKHLARAIARAGLRACGLPLRVEADAALQQGPWIFVSNHASYLDWLVLTAVLPPEASFVAKRELAARLPLRWLLERVGVRFVERDEVQASVDDARRLVAAAKGGVSLVFFPEGTLTRAPGLRAFRMGAFVAAAQTASAVVPVSLKGTRSVLRDGSWWPRREPVVVHLHRSLHAEGSGWSDAVALRDRARAAIAESCAEPVLAT